MRKSIFCFFIVMFFLATWLYGEERFYTVKRGETLFSIARTMGLKAEDLMKFNGISDPSKLQTGQRLRIPSPTGQASPPQAGRAANYQVVRGDTLYSIARKFSVSVTAIQEANNFLSGRVLRVGDTLRIPSAGTQAPVSSSVLWPVNATEISYMTGKLSGVVITGRRTEPVKSLTYGTVLSAGPYRGFGRVVIVQVEGSYLYVYGGCESLSVKEGDKVAPGTELGNLGVDAVSNRPQLFFMVYRSNVPIDPAKAPRA